MNAVFRSNSSFICNKGGTVGCSRALDSKYCDVNVSKKAEREESDAKWDKEKNCRNERQ